MAAFEDEWLLMQRGYSRPKAGARVRRAARRLLAVVVPGLSDPAPLQIEPETFR